jgi:signal transduction histidine kinase
VTDNLTSPSAFSDEQRQARGIFGFTKAMGTAIEQFFRRSYAKQPATPSATAPAQAELLRKIQNREAEITHLTAVLDSIGEGVIMQDNDGRIIMMNEAAYNLLGSQKAFWESDLARLYESARQVIGLNTEFELIGDPIRTEINDRILGAQVAAVSDDQGGRLGTVIVLRDVTRAALADRLKDDFVTQVSHELRTPLTAIKGMSDVLLSQPLDRPPNRRFLEAIGRNVDVLDRMIVELLDISEISGGTFAIRQEELVLDDLIWSVIRGLQSRWERAKLEVHVISLRREKTNVLGDNRRLRWALGHVLENSINYTQEGGTITARIGEISQGRVQIHIEDTGVGIRSMDLPHVFNRFYRGEARTADDKAIDPRGLGQGLFIARAVAEAHKGYLGIDSKVGVGTVVTMALPLPGSTVTGDTAPLIEPPVDPGATTPNASLALPPKRDS